MAGGGTVRVRVEGYRPGEQVTLALHDAVLGSTTADEEGTVTTEVLVPAWSAPGAAIDVIGEGRVAEVPLDVAPAASSGTPDGAPRLPLLAAACALTGSGAALVRTAAHRRRAIRP